MKCPALKLGCVAETESLNILAASRPYGSAVSKG